MPHTNKHIDEAIENARKAAENAAERAVREFLAVANQMREKVILMLTQAGTIDASTAQQIKQQIRSLVMQYEARFSQVLTDNQKRLFVKGIQIVDAAVDSGRVLRAVPYLSETTLNTLKAFGADLITNLTETARARITSVIDLAMMGQKPMQEVVNEIGRNLKDPSVFGTIARRSEIIMRTEGNRINQLATSERIKQVGKQIPDLKKRWQHSHLGQPRNGHLDLDGVTIAYDEKFSLEGEDGKTYLIAAPYDPILPVGEQISCRCKIYPVVGRFEETSKSK